MKKIYFFLFFTQLVYCTRAQELLSAGGKYNIVLFIADDLGVNDTEPYGNKVVRTPHLKNFAKQALLFNQAFAGSPTCTPSRSTIFTGLMPLRHGAHGNHSGVKDDTRSFVHYLQPLGYKVAIAGKYHVGPEALFPFERVSKTNLPEPGHESKPGLNYDLMMDPVDNWLSAQKKKMPFMLVVADHSPHVIWPEKSSYDPKQVDIPSKHIDTRETRTARARYYSDVSKMDGNFGKLLASLDKNGLSKNTIVIFLADQGPQWPFAKWSLYDDGVKVPLLIRWPGVVKAAAKTNALVSLADLLPTLVESAGGQAPADIDGQSFLAVLKGQKNTHRQFVFATHTGDGLMNRSPQRMLRTPRYKYILNLAPEILYTTHMDRAKDHDGGREYWDSWRSASFSNAHAAQILWRYHNRPKEELYDLEADRHELRNLATDSRYTKLLETYRTTLEGWRNQQQDTITGPELITRPAAGTPQKPVAPYVFLE
jgi:N-sulfoglucosamine sulfohydrolase